MRKFFFFLLALSVLFPKSSFGAEYGGYSSNSYPMSGTIVLSPMEKFSGLSRTDVLNKRISAVKTSSVFGNIPDYRPSGSVFQIEDGLPWIGAHELTCYGISGSKDIGKGESRESVGILNPELLFVINMASFAFHDRTGCSSVDYLIPYRAYYNKPLNTISAYIDYSGFYRKNRIYTNFILEDANARDLGYNYVFADKIKNVRFKDQTNFSTEITSTSGFFHRGGSCRAPGGCNNYSPYEVRYDFAPVDPTAPMSLHIKLWKNRPAGTSEPADINYELVLQ